MKKPRITQTATDKGIERAWNALKRNFNSKRDFAKFSLVSPSTINKFFGRKPIQSDCFQKICEELELSDWREIAGIEQTEKLKVKEIDCPSNTNLNEEKESVQTLTRQITVTDEHKGLVLAVITLQGDLNLVSNQKIFESILREHSGRTIKIIDVKEGSIKLFVEGSSEDIKQIVSLIKSKKITELNGFPIKEIEIIDKSSDTEEATEFNNKWSLVKEIVSQPVKGRKLSSANLSVANLSGADLSYASLYRANLSYADLRGADLYRANLSDANLSDANLYRANLSDANLSDANLSDANLSDANLYRANLRRANLRNIKIDEKTKLDPKWRKVWKIVNKGAKNQNLRGANLSDANLCDANLCRADLLLANLSDANLCRADLKDANLRHANLRRADLKDANLRHANLRRADLKDANLNGANLNGANLKNANVEDTRFSSNSQGISEFLKQDLINRGAIFEDSSGDRYEVFKPV